MTAGTPTIAALLIAATVATAAADPRPKPRGDKPPRPIVVSTSVPLSGPLAPRRAREWLVALGPSFPWGDRLAAAEVLAERRDVVSVRLGDTLVVDLRVYRDLVAVVEHGTCCCGSCAEEIRFFRAARATIADVTDATWPRFRFVTELGTTFDRLTFALGRRTIAIRDDRGPLYRLRRDRSSGRFEVAWRRRGAEPPYPRRD